MVISKIDDESNSDSDGDIDLEDLKVIVLEELVGLEEDIKSVSFDLKKLFAEKKKKGKVRKSNGQSLEFIIKKLIIHSVSNHFGSCCISIILVSIANQLFVCLYYVLLSELCPGLNRSSTLLSSLVTSSPNKTISSTSVGR